LSAPLVSVIVLFDRGVEGPCLNSVLSQQGVELEVLAVVGSEQARSSLENTKNITAIVVEDRNPAVRRNRAVEKAAGKYLAFIDDDAFAPRDWLKKSIDYLEENDSLAGVGGPNFLPSDSSFAETLTDLVLCTPLLGAGSRAYSGGGEPAAGRPGEVHLVNMILRKEWFERVGGLNEALGYGGEDTEFLHLLSSKEGEVVFHPEIFVYHRRRPFGFSYFRQRLRLRGQSGRLFIAYPGIYTGSPSFWVALLAPFVVLVLLIMATVINSLLPAALIIAALYIAVSIPLSLSAVGRSGNIPAWKKPLFFFLLPPALFIHLAINLAGLWGGIILVLVQGISHVRSELRRTPGEAGE